MKDLKRVFANKGVEFEYRRKLNKLVDGMNKSVMYWVLANLGNRTPKQMAKEIQKRIKQWQKVFGKQSEIIAEWFVRTLYNHTITDMKNAFKEADIKVKPRIPKKTVSAVYIENENLIKSIPEKYFEGVEVVAMLALLYGWDRKRFAEELKKRHMIAIRRVKNIASDQTHKTTEVFKMVICSDAKIKYARWQYTYLSKTPREQHIHMNGDLFDIEKGCYDSKVGEYIYPAELVNCYHKDTEVMTKEGFKKFTDLKISDRILTLNPETKEIEYSGIKNFYKKYSEDIVNIKGKSFNLSVDKDHRFFCYREVDHEKYKAVEPEFVDGVQNLKSKSKFYKSCVWRGSNNDELYINGYKIKTETFCRFMGYYLSDGSYLHNRNGNQIYIAREKGKKQDKEFNDLIELNPKRGVGGIYIFNKALCDYIKRFGYSYQKYIPDEIKRLDKKYIRIFLDSFASCDGTPKKERENPFSDKKMNVYNRYYTSSKKMADDLVECIIKTGMSASYGFREKKGTEQQFKNGIYTIKTDIYSISEIKKQYDQLSSCKIEIQPYNDFVYDIEVEKNNTLLIRFKNCVHWNGNCKCSFIPVLEEHGEDIRKEIEKRVYYKKVARG